MHVRKYLCGHETTWMGYKACTLDVKFIIFLDILPEGYRPAGIIIRKF